MSLREVSKQSGLDRQRPEQVFFEDPALDRLMGVVLALATEHAVLGDRVRALEAALVAREVLDPSALEESASNTADLGDRTREASAFAEALMCPLTGVQQARGATGMFSLMGSRRRDGNE